MIQSFCPPSIVYLVFTLTHVLMALFDNNIKGAFLQLVMGILITLLLQMLCMNGLSFFSWIIVFLPLVFYTYMTLLLYNIFGKGEDLENKKE